METEAKQFVFRYNGDASTDEEENDFIGDQPVPEVGDVVERKGKKWKVAHIFRDLGRPVLLYKVFLTD
jgi:hypothetical protein